MSGQDERHLRRKVCRRMARGQSHALLLAPIFHRVAHHRRRSSADADLRLAKEITKLKGTFLGKTMVGRKQHDYGLRRD
jgi:hypothetical protein